MGCSGGGGGSSSGGGDDVEAGPVAGAHRDRPVGVAARRRRASGARFALGLAARVALLLALLSVLALALATPGLAAARVVAALAALLAVAGLWRFVRRTNLELARFVDALRFGDLAQNFARAGDGGGFDELGSALDDGIRRLRDERARALADSRYHEALVDDSPAALVVVDGDGRVELANKAARRLFAQARGVRVADFAVHGAAFAEALAALPPGQSRRLTLSVGPMPQAAVVRAAALHRWDGDVRVLAVQPIQRELDAAELAAQTDLVRVLSHEIMNSMTPVTSLAHSAAALMAEADRGDDARVAAAHDAVRTLARRADAVARFVEAYRAVSEPPHVRRRRFDAAPWVADLATVVRACDWARGVAFGASVEPPTLTLDADPELLGQVLLNAVKNGAEAAAAHAAAPRVALSVRPADGGSVCIEVTDNGPGVPPALRREVFLPFYTTKPRGTGIGLSLARQIALAHGGAIEFGEAEGGGGRLRFVV